MEDVVLLPSGISKQAREGQEADNTPRPDCVTYPITFNGQTDHSDTSAQDENDLVIEAPSGLYLST